MSARSDQIATYAAQLNTAYPPGPDGTGKNVDFGKDYTVYMNAHPKADPKITYETVLARISLLLGVPIGIGKAITGAGAATGQIGKGVGAGASALYPQWLQDFLNNNGVLRIAEGLIGVLIIGVSVSKLTGSVNPVVKIVKGVTG